MSMFQTETAGVLTGAGGSAGLADLLSIDQLSGATLEALIDKAIAVKADRKLGAGALSGKSVTMLFEKPSLRTRMSFEIGLTGLGAHVVYFDHSKQKIGERESVKDYARNLERWTDCVIARVFSHAVIEEMALHARIPVVNALSDLEHPCQAVADMQTLKEQLGTFQGVRLAYVGDGNNVCHSLLLACAKLGVSMTVVSPRGFEPKFCVVKRALAAAEESGATIAMSHDVADVAGHHAVYTDTWVSMGQGHQATLRAEAFGALQVDEEVMAQASRGLGGPSIFMHCLPAHRGQEVVDEVIDAAYSVVYDQAENRMHAQNALFIELMGERAGAGVSGGG